MIVFLETISPLQRRAISKEEKKKKSRARAATAVYTLLAEHVLCVLACSFCYILRLSLCACGCADGCKAFLQLFVSFSIFFLF